MSLIVRAVLESWIGQGRHVVQELSPSLEQLRRLFDGLDGNFNDTLSIERDDHGSMLIGGGPDRFVVQCFLPDGGSFHAVRLTDDRGSQKVQVGGRAGEFPADHVLDSHSAWRMASVYIESQSMDAETTWVKNVDLETEWSEYTSDENA